MSENKITFLKTKYRKTKELLNLFTNYKTFFQFIFPKTIPFIIINFNQLFYLKKLVDFAIKRGFKKIVIIDNVSTYPPLLEYYEEIEKKVTIERMSENFGHMVFFNRKELYNKYGKGFFILTDADIEPNENLPKNFLRVLLHWLLKYSKSITKVGFALEIKNIPNHYSEKEKVLVWEKQFWDTPIEKDVYMADIDTTFALYKPNAKKHLKKDSDFFKAIRIAGNFTCKHAGWYTNYDQLTEEQEYFINLANTSSSWIDTKKNQKNSPIDKL